MSGLLASISQWTPSEIPTKTTLSSIDPLLTSTLEAVISSYVSKAATATFAYDLNRYQRSVQAALASISIASAEEIRATATAQAVIDMANEVIFNSTLMLDYAADSDNLYSYNLVWAPNIIYLIVFGVSFFFTVAMLWKSRYHWYNITFIIAMGLEFSGFICRCVSVSDNTLEEPFLGQTVCLIIAPAFIMGGIYFLFAQLVVIYGRSFSVLKPLWYSYIFIAGDVFSILIQAAGGAAASVASNQKKDTAPGLNLMIAGVAIQTGFMTMFLYFLFSLMFKIYFKHRKELKELHPLGRPTLGNWIKLMINTREANAYKQQYLEPYYNPKFESIRARKLYKLYPLVILVAVIFVYIRCVYRVVELAQGWSGWLITREWPLMVLDSFMVAVVALLFIPFHPVLALGSENVIKLRTIRGRKDIHDDELSETTSSTNAEVPELSNSAPEKMYDAVE